MTMWPLSSFTRRPASSERVIAAESTGSTPMTLISGRTRLTYRLRAETPGTYQVLPSLASLTYFPEIRGNAGLVRAKIGERP